MRKTSQDGGDTTSITSGIENEIKKPGAIIKSKRNSIKRKVQSLSHESDDAVIEPLLQKEKEKPDNLSNQSAKYDLLSKTKTEAHSERGNDRERLLQDDKLQKATLSNARNGADTVISMPCSNQLPKSTGVTAPLHNHMNTNVFNSHDALKGLITTKSQILVEIDGSKQSGYNPSPLIFTTAKIHTDGKNKHMEPLQVTPVPILSTIEVSVLKGTGINNSAETTGAVTSNISPMYTNVPKSNTNIQDSKIKCTLPVAITTLASKIVDNKSLKTSEKQTVSSDMPNKDKKSIDSTLVNIATETKLMESKKDKDGKQTKLSLSQPMSGLSSGEIKTTATSGISKPVVTAVNTKSSTAFQSNKESMSSILDQKMHKNTVDENKGIERKTDLNKNFTSVDIPKPGSSETSDKKVNTTSKDKIAMNSMSSSSKQLQRQKVAIDKDDPNTKSKSGASLSNEIKFIKKSDETSAQSSKSTTQIKSPTNDMNRLNETAKLPTTANKTQVASQIATTNTKPSVTNIITTAANKSTNSNSVISTKASVTSQAPSKTIVAKSNDTRTSSTVLPSSIEKSQPSKATVESQAKLKDTPISSQEIPRNISNKSSAASMSDKKSHEISAVTIPTTTQSTPIAKTTDMQPSIKTAISQSVVTKPNDTNAKVSSIAAKNLPINTAKSPSGTTSTEKSSSITTGSTKGTATTTNTAKVPPISTNIAKSPAVTTTTAKSPVVTTTSIKSPPATISTVKSPAITTTTKITAATSSTVKAAPVTSTAKVPPASASIAKVPPTSANTTKVSSVTTGITTAKSTPASTVSAKAPSITTTSKSNIAKDNVTPISKTSVTTPTVPSTIVGTISTNTTTPPSGSTSNSTAPTKKSDAKSTELSNGNKSLKA